MENNLNEINTLLKLARAKLRSKKLYEAVKFYEEVLAKDKNNFSANYDIGIIYLMLKNNESAAEYLEKAYSLDPTNKDAYYYYILAKGRLRKQFEKPISIQIETTSLCNARCKICPNPSMKRSKGIMDDNLFKKIINDCKDIQPYEIYPFITGEPFTDKNIIERIKYINDVLPNTKVKIFTNATLLNKEIINQLNSLNIDGIVVSFNGATKSTYEKQMGINYEKSIENVKLLSQTSIPIIVSMVITKETLPEANLFRNMWKNFNVNTILSSFKNYAGKFERDVALPVPKRCGRVLTQMTIMSNGLVSLCCMDNEGEIILGDVNKNSLLEIWNNDKAKEIREKHISGKKDEISICKNCTSA